MKLSPDFEKPFLEYQALVDRGKDQRTALAVAILGDEVYARRTRMPGYNGDVDMLREPRVAVKRAGTWGIPTSKHAHALRADALTPVPRAMDEEYQDYLGRALQRYGEGDGRTISGIYRSHFPASVKNRLRFLSHGLPMVQDAVRLHEYLAKTRSATFT
jgi:hypothetical protein